MLKKRSLASRLSALYVTLLGITVVVVILASSIALVVELFGYTGDIMVAKHEEARVLAEQYRLQGFSMKVAAPQIVRQLSGIGLRVTIFDMNGRYLAGDRALRPKWLDRIVAAEHARHDLRARGGTPFGPPGPRMLPPGRAGVFVPPRVLHRLPMIAHEAPFLTTVDGGFVAFAPSLPLLLVSLEPYWRVVLTIAVIAIVLSWFAGRIFAGQALKPIAEVSDSLRAIADGDYTQRRFVMAGGDDIAELTAAYNDAVAGVAGAMEERRRVEDRMRQFAADAGHELRTPLTVIGGYIDVLRRGAVEEPGIARQILATMAMEKEHMRTLIDRLMRLARMDAEAAPTVETIDVATLLRDQCEAARRLDERRAIDYSVEGAPTVEGDRTELGEALWNIVENALKYAPDAPIHMRAECVDGRTHISVSDEGPGMSEAERLHAFERFYRGDQRGEIAGTGLGLSIAKRAVERSGGRIEIASSPGRGTVVTIVL